ncbi:MAG: DUF2461 domain-containing protein [Prevotella sp.]|nr:DUF2461 domain-containing protein [Prevotella sp.]MDY4218497.1 DUF2461 domain-containing protein [Prevotella sp.]
MNINQIQDFLKQIAANNNREWFQANRAAYDEARQAFEQGVAEAITELSLIDTEVAHLTVRDCTYRFHRDTRFSPDKTPYKRHMGAFICAKGKKSLRGGYYFQIQPGNNIIAVGSYFLPTNILTSCRNEIMGNIDTWRSIVESKAFLDTFGKPNKSQWTNDNASERGFGLTSLKKAPKDFPSNYEHIEYLRMKDYCCWVKVPDAFFEGEDWAKRFVSVCKIGKPMMDFMNSVIDDYED